MKTCTTCEQAKADDGFYRSSAFTCKVCIRDRTIRWRLQNPERARVNDRRKRHGDHAATDGACAICGRLGPRVVDHDHAICARRTHSCDECRRDQLCGPCNNGLGFFYDDPALMRQAALYIERHRGTST